MGDPLEDRRDRRVRCEASAASDYTDRVVSLRRLAAFLTGRTEQELNPDFVRLARKAFRRTRAFLGPHIFAVGGDVPDPPATQLIDRERWNHVMHLADDVALRSSSYSAPSLHE
jgi:hypothetical protein